MLKGHVEPRIYTMPLRDVDNDPDATLGFEAITFAEDILEVTLLDWQKWFLKHVLELNKDGSLRFRTALLCIARQNGKSFIMTILALYFMMVLNEGELVLGTAQNLETSEGTWEDAVNLAESIPYLKRKIPKARGVNRVNGNKYLRFDNKSTWKVAVASRKGGRGKAAKLVLMDELREHQNFEAWAAISNTTLAQNDALVLGVSNAGDAKSVVLKQQRDKAIAKIDDPDTTIAIFEWSTPEEMDPEDEAGWMYANPSCNKYPSNLTLDNLRAAHESATDVDWRIENLCQWVTVAAQGPWNEGTWESLVDPQSQFCDDKPVTLAIDASIGQRMAYIALAGWTTEGKQHIEIIASREGTAWVAPWLDKRFDAIGPTHVVLQGPTGTPVSAIADLIEEKRIPITWLKGSDVTTSTAKFYEAVKNGEIVHRDQQLLTLSAQTTQLHYTPSGTYMFKREKNAPVDSEPLIAVSEAWYFLTHNPTPIKRSAYEDRGLMVV